MSTEGKVKVSKGGSFGKINNGERVKKKDCVCVRGFLSYYPCSVDLFPNL